MVHEKKGRARGICGSTRVLLWLWPVLESVRARKCDTGASAARLALLVRNTFRFSQARAKEIPIELK